MDGESDLVGRVIGRWGQERPEIDVSSIGVVGRIHSLAEWLTEQRTTLYAEYAIGPGEFDVMAALLRSGEPYEMSPSAIADWTVVSSGAVTKRVDRCIEQGWVTRRAGKSDGRSRVVALTPEGQELIEAVWQASVNRSHELLRGLEAREAEQLAKLLSKWSSALGVEHPS